MLIKQISRDGGETVQIVVKNLAGAAISTGMGASYIGAAASIDGVGVSKLVAAGMKGFCGVAAHDIATGDFGRLTCFGLAASVQLSHVGSSITITKGDILKPGAVAGTFFSSITDEALSTLAYRYVIAVTTPVAVSTLAQSYCKGIVMAT